MWSRAEQSLQRLRHSTYYSPAHHGFRDNTTSRYDSQASIQHELRWKPNLTCDSIRHSNVKPRYD